MSGISVNPRNLRTDPIGEILYRPDPGSLSSIDDLILVRTQNPLTFIAIAYDRIEGFTGGIFLDIDDLPLEEIARRIDAANASGDEVPFVAIEADPPKALLENILGEDIQTNKSQGFSREQLLAVSEMVKSHISPEHIPMIGKETLDWLNFFSTGDVVARAQALDSFPLCHDLILENPDIRKAIDDRTPLLPVLAERFNLNTAQARRYGQIEARFFKDSKGGNTSLSHLRSHAISAAIEIRDDQVPKAQESSVFLVNYFKSVFDIQRSTDLGSGIFRRHMAKVSSDGWFDATRHLKENTESNEVRDYLNSIKTAISTALLVDEIRKDPAIDLDRLRSTAEKVWEKSPVDSEDAIALKSFITSFNRIYLGSVREAVGGVLGQMMTVKNVREYQTRWHHMRQTYEDEVMSNPEPLHWGSIIGCVEINGLTFRELTSSEALESQGHRERHCVGGYVSHVLSATSDKATLIFSIEKGEEVLSTLEVTLSRSPWERGKFSWENAQHKARRNSTPCQEAVLGAELLLNRLSEIPKSEIRAYLSGIQSNTGQLRDEMARVIKIMGANIFNRNLPEVTLDAYGEVLPKGLRGASISDVRAEVSKVNANAIERIKESAAEVIRKMPESSLKKQEDLSPDM